MLRAFSKVIRITIITLLVLAAVGLTAPSDFKLTRSVQVSAPAHVVYDHIADLNHWPNWLAVKQVDPAIKIQVSSHAKGNGAHLRWLAPQYQGELSITAAHSDSIHYQALINEHALSIGEFQLVPNANGTEVIWTLSGNVSYAVIGSYMAYAAKYVLKDVMTHSLNNLATMAQLAEQQKTPQSLD